ncbi:MAG: DUF2125 domain-containing protein [Bauldia sp.]
MAAGLAAVLVALWAGYWFAADRLARTAVERALAAPVAGHRVGCRDPVFGGFPLRIDLRCQRLTYARDGEAVTAALGGLAASAPLYRPGVVDAILGSPLQVNAPALGVALTATWSHAAADLSAWLDGPRGGVVRFISLAVEDAADPPGLPVTGLRAATAEAGVTPTADGHRLTIAVAGLGLTRETGATLPDIDGEASVTAEGLGPLGMNPVARLLDWLRAGASVRIDHLRLAAAGAVVIAEGGLELSEEGLLSGSVLLRFNSVDAFAALLEAIRPGARERYALALQGLNAVSLPVQTGEGMFRQTALTFTDGVVWLGIIPLPIDPIPPIRF